MNLGFITGGQLGQMMIQSFLPMQTSEKIFVLDGDKNCPCSRFANEVVVGSSKDYQTVLDFGSRCDIIILEFEHVNIDALKALEKKGIKVIAQPRYVEIIQNKGKQKEFLVKNNIPTADFILVKNKAEILPSLEIHNLPKIQKTCFDGYDGGGVKKLSKRDDIHTAFDAPSVLEECIDIEREFSLIIGRDDLGTEFRYPLIEQSFHSTTHIVDTIWFAKNIPEDIIDQINSIEAKLMTAFKGTGMYAVELFLDTSKKIYVNEIAPRVHNSGHHTIECSVTSQFEQYIRVALGYPAGSTKTIQNGVMLNLLGKEGHNGATQYIGKIHALWQENTHLHLYGKTTTKPHRKMGHITSIGKTLSESHKKIEAIRRKVEVVSIENKN